MNQPNPWRLAACAAALAVLGLSSAASAQAINAGVDFNPYATGVAGYDRGANVSVLDRSRPQYEAQGLLLGAFTVYPKLTASLAWDDNIYAAHASAVSDELFAVTPEITVQSNWPRDMISAFVRAPQEVYFSHSAEDAFQYDGGAKGKFQFGDSALTAGVEYDHSILPRSATNTGQQSKNRIPLDYTVANLALEHTFTRLRLTAEAEFEDYVYGNGETSAGQLVQYTNQNHVVGTYSAKAEYATSPDTAVFVTGDFNQRRYQLGPPDVPTTYDSSGFDIAGGVNFDFTHLLRGELELGYLDQTYANRRLRPLTGLSAKGKVEWFPTQLTTVTVTVMRAAQDSTVTNSPGFLTVRGTARVDHELLRNLILSATGNYGEDQYVGIVRTDDHWSAGLSADWLLNRRVGLTFAYLHTDDRSSGTEAGPSYGDNRLTVSTVLQF